MKTALFLYDFTGIMAKPWLDSGYICVSFDGQHPTGITRIGNHIKVGMWFTGIICEDALEIIKVLHDAEIEKESVKFIFGFPECTHMAVSGARSFAKKVEKDPDIQERSVRLAKLVAYTGTYFKCPFGMENPVSILSTKWRKPDFSFHPWEFGGYLPEEDQHPIYPDYIAPRDAYPKKTCIWCGNGFVEPKRRPVSCPSGYSTQYHKLGGKSLKTKNIRSATPRGFALAVFEANGITKKRSLSIF